MLMKRRKNPLFTLWELNASSFEQTWIPFTQGCFVPNLVEIGSAVQENILKFRQCIFAISLISPLGKGLALHLYKLQSSSPKEELYSVWLKLAQWFWRRFLNFINVFSLFLYYLPLRTGWGPSFEQTFTCHWSTRTSLVRESISIWSALKKSKGKGTRNSFRTASRTEAVPKEDKQIETKLKYQEAAAKTLFDIAKRHHGFSSTSITASLDAW